MATVTLYANSGTTLGTTQGTHAHPGSVVSDEFPNSVTTHSVSVDVCKKVAGTTTVISSSVTSNSVQGGDGTSAQFTSTNSSYTPPYTDLTGATSYLVLRITVGAVDDYSNIWRYYTTDCVDTTAARGYLSTATSTVAAAGERTFGSADLEQVGTTTLCVGGGYAYITTTFTDGSQQYPVSGVVAATTAVAGAVNARFKAVGAVGATTAVAGTVNARLKATGVVPVVSSVSGAVKALLKASGVINAISGTAGTAIMRFPVSGAVPASSGVSGTVTKLGPVQGTVSAVSSVSGDIEALLAARGSVDIVSSASASITAALAAAGQCAITSGAFGNASVLSITWDEASSITVSWAEVDETEATWYTVSFDAEDLGWQ